MLPIALAIIALATLGVAVAVGSFTPADSSATSQPQSPASAVSRLVPPQCSAPCTVWKDEGGSIPESVAISPNDALVVIGNTSGIYAFGGQGGNLLWSHALNRTIISLTISASGGLVAAGGYQLQGGPVTAITFTNGEIYLFNSTSGQLLWSKGTGIENPVFKVILSADGSKLTVDTEDSIMLLGAQQGNTIWSYETGGNTVGLGMSADGSLVVASIGSTIAAFSDQGTMVWSYPGMVLAVSVNSVAVSPDGSYAWVGSAVSGYNGSLYLFNKQGILLWQRQIYSPVLSIQTGGNLTAFVSTNWGALLYGADGSLLQNVTNSSPVIHSDCTYVPAFWYWGSGNQTVVAFFDSQGNAISSYNPGEFTVNVALSADGQYAAIVSQQGVGSNSSFSLAFVYLGQPSQTCIHD